MIAPIRGRKFKIDLVNNKVSRLHQEITEKAIECTQINIDLQAIVAKRAEEKRPFTPEEVKAVEEYSQRVNEAKKMMVSNRWEIIKQLMVANNIEFDFNFWDTKVSANDMNEFILFCIENDRNTFADGKSTSKKK